MDIIKIIEKINEVGLSNNDITRYGDGFEDAIFKVKEVITELYKETQALQLQGLYLEKEERKAILEAGHIACCGKQLSEKSIELFFKSNESCKDNQ